MCTKTKLTAHPNVASIELWLNLQFELRASFCKLEIVLISSVLFNFPVKLPFLAGYAITGVKVLLSLDKGQLHTTAGSRRNTHTHRRHSDVPVCSNLSWFPLLNNKKKITQFNISDYKLLLSNQSRKNFVWGERSLGTTNASDHLCIIRVALPLLPKQLKHDEAAATDAGKQ